jgi:hypothetical protein
MLGNKTSLEAITGKREYTPPFEDYVSVLSTLQPNTTLTYLALELGTCVMTDDQANKLTSIIKKNYGLKRVTAIQRMLVDLHTILRPNEAGHRYLQRMGFQSRKDWMY